MKRIIGIRALVLLLAALALAAGPIDRAHAASPTFGAFDLIEWYWDGTIRVAGWAATADSPQTALPILVYIDGQYVLPNSKVGSTYRPDVPGVIGGQ